MCETKASQPPIAERSVPNGAIGFEDASWPANCCPSSLLHLLRSPVSVSAPSRRRLSMRPATRCEFIRGKFPPRCLQTRRSKGRALSKKQTEFVRLSQVFACVARPRRCSGAFPYMRVTVVVCRGPVRSRRGSACNGPLCTPIARRGGRRRSPGSGGVAGATAGRTCPRGAAQSKTPKCGRMQCGRQKPWTRRTAS